MANVTRVTTTKQGGRTMAHLENGYTQLATSILLDLARAGLTAGQWAVLMTVFYYTYGQVDRLPDGAIRRDEEGRPLKLKVATITLPVFCQHTGLSRRAVINALNDLAARNILTREVAKGRPTRYGYQKYSDQWKGVKQTAPVHHTAPVKQTALGGCSGLHQGGEADCTGGVKQTAPILNKNKNKGNKREPPPLEELLKRYGPRQQEFIHKYWDQIRLTRKTGKLAESIKRNFMEKWDKYPVATVLEGMGLHMKKHEGKREEYTHGIIRRLAAEKKTKEGDDQDGKGTGFDFRKFEYGV